MPPIRYPFNPSVLSSLPMGLSRIYQSMEGSLLQMICSRLQASDQLNEVTVQAIRALRGHGIPLDEIRDNIAKYTGRSKKEVDDLFDDVVNWNRWFYGNMADMAGLTQPESFLNATAIEAIRRQAQRQMENITASMGFLINGQMYPPAQAYQWALDNAALLMQSGAVGYNEAIADTVRQLAASGLKTQNLGGVDVPVVTYSSGVVTALDVAVRRALMTGINQLNQKYREQSMEYLGTDLVEVTAHLGARNIDGPKGWENHAKWQGKVYRWAKQKGSSKGQYPDFEKTCGMGDVQGIGGANCRHSYWPFIEGIMERTYTDDELEAMKPENRALTEFNGRFYDDYQATQYQRRMEASYRKQRRIEIAAAAAGDDKGATNAKIRQQLISARYRKFSAAAGLPEQRERMRIYERFKKQPPPPPPGNRPTVGGSGGGGKSGGSGSGAGGASSTKTGGTIIPPIPKMAMTSMPIYNSGILTGASGNVIIPYDNTLSGSQTPAPAQSSKNKGKGKGKAKGKDREKGKDEDGEDDVRVSRQKQVKHIIGTKEYEQYLAQRNGVEQSTTTLSYDEIEQLIKKHRGKGDPYTTKTGQIKSGEYCTDESPVGYYYKDGKPVETKRFLIIYSKTGAHIVPVQPFDPSERSV